MATTSPRPNKLGRNDPCPVCGKKMKKCLGHGQDDSRFPWGGLAFGLLLIGAINFALYLAYGRTPPAPQPTATPSSWALTETTCVGWMPPSAPRTRG